MKFKFLVIILSGIILFNSALSQETKPLIIKSTNKVKIEGKYYYIHIVRKGETLYSISRAYEVSQIDIAMENPDIYLGLQVDQALKIPVKGLPEEKEGDKYIYHIVKKGETLFGLSRSYQVEMEDIIRVNPDVQSGLMLSQVVLIPRDRLNTLGSKRIDDSLRFIYHQVKPKEGLYGISKLYNVSQSTIEKFNKDILTGGLKYGSILKIPRNPADTVLNIISKPIAGRIDEEIKEPVQKIDTLVLSSVKCDTFNYNTSKPVFNIVLMLPFEADKSEEEMLEAEIITGEKSNVKPVRAEKPETVKSNIFFDFYQGFLIAVDSIKADGVSLNLSVFDTKKDFTELNTILSKKELEDCNLIIGPAYPEAIKPASDFAKAKEIMMVSPLSSTPHLLNDNPYLFQVFPSFQTQLNEFVQKLELCAEANMVFVYEADSTNINMIESYKSLLSKKIGECHNSDSLHFKEISYLPGGNNVEIKDKINQSLILEKENIIFVPSDNEAFVSDFLSHLYALTTYYGYGVKVYGFPRWQKFKNIPVNYYYDMNLHLFTTYFIDYSNRDVKNFLEKYRSYYRSEPTQYSFQGYDTGIFFAKALKKYGSDFRYCIKDQSNKLLQTEYHFQQVNSSGGFENKSIYLIRYTKDFDIIRVE